MKVIECKASTLCSVWIPEHVLIGDESAGGNTLEAIARVVSVVVGVVLLIAAVFGWLVGDDPNEQMATLVLINIVGAILGSAVAWWYQKREGDQLRLRQIIYGSIGGACTLWIVLGVATNSGGLVEALGNGVGGGLSVGLILGMIWYGIRGPLEEDDHETPQTAES